MFKYPTTRFVFDRKKLASNTTKGLIQIEILFERKRKFVSTGVKVFKNQWSAKIGVCNSFDMTELNKRISAMKARIDEYISGLIEAGETFTFDNLEQKLSQQGEEKETFISFVSRLIDERKDIRESTKKTQRKLLTSLAEFKRIVQFSDLTKKNIVLYDEFLKSKGIRQTTVRSYHKTLKIYVNAALKREYISTNPYADVKIKRGESESGRWLTSKEFEAVKNARIDNEALNDARNLFVLQCFTGLSYSDLMTFDFTQIQDEGGTKYFSHTRSKTGVEYCAVLLPEAMSIINQYKGKLPKMANQIYNRNLKFVAMYAGINKPIASHWGRRTCGMLLLNKGVSIEIVAKVLGHSSIRTTESVYAKILDRSVIKEVKDKW